MKNITFGAVVLLGFSCFCLADDWPQWQGPQRDGIWREQGVIDEIPAGGLPIKWRAPVNYGYSGPAVAAGRVYAMDYVVTSGDLKNNPGGRSRLNGLERVLCLDAETGKVIWTHSYERAYDVSYAGGPRCTPTVDADRVYTLGCEGDLYCLNAENGAEIWHRDFNAEYNTKTPEWGYAAHPLVIGDLVYCVVGGQGSVAVAFNKHTGEEVWRALSATEPGYCPPTLIEHAGTPQLLIWHAQSLNALDPQSGKVYWSFGIEPGYGMSIVGPRKQGNRIYVCAMSNVSAMIELGASATSAEILWRGDAKNSIYCSNSTPFLDGTMIFGCDIETGALVGARQSDGERIWLTKEPMSQGRRDRHSTTFLVKHDDRYFLFSELGDLILARLSEQGYDEQGRFHVLDPTNEAFGRPVVWSHPAFAQKCMFARNDQEIVCVDLAGSR